MTTIFNIARPLLALAATALCTSLAAAEPLVVTGQSARPLYQERVAITDLDLREWWARQTLFARVMRASTDVCIRYEGKINIDKVMGGAEHTCPNRTYRAAKPQIAAAIRQARLGQQETAMAVMVGVPTAAR